MPAGPDSIFRGDRPLPVLTRPIAGAAARAALVAAMAAWGPLAGAQPILPRPITIVVSFPPGASADATMRMIAQKVTDTTGQPFVIENRSGGGATVSAMAVKHAAPDGGTLLQVVVGTHAVNQSLGGEASYDLSRDFAPITQLWNLPLLLVVPAGSPATSVPELVALAKSKPGGLNYVSSAVNSAPHLLGVMLATVSGAHMVHVPYRGAAPALTDLVAGRVDFYFVSYASVLGFMAEGKLRALAVASASRLKALPDVPTMAEAGYPDVKLDAQFGLLAPAKTPEPMVQKLHDAFARAATDPDLVARMAEQGVEIVTNSPAEFGALIAAATGRVDRVLKAAGVTDR
jgi:tripartite-type tricarboxylate transporter receptor subunit TctC